MVTFEVRTSLKAKTAACGSEEEDYGELNYDSYDYQDVACGSKEEDYGELNYDSYDYQSEFMTVESNKRPDETLSICTGTLVQSAYPQRSFKGVLPFTTTPQ